MNRQRGNGFVLLVILVLLTLAAAALAGVCRVSLRNALASTEDAGELQRRWGALSCETAILPHAEILLQQAEALRHRPVASLDMDIQLGGQDFSVHVADEQAKVNLNFIYQTRGRAAAEAAARVATRNVGDRLLVTLRPSDVAPPLVSFGQVFSASPATSLSASADITCWGDGRLNWRRASAAALAGQCQQALGVAAVQRLLALQSDNPAPGLADLMNDPQLAQGQQTGELIKLLRFSW
ncbi:MAG: hypothetical protein ABSH22_08035 [Tepidisphaeraceae bacterium]